MSEGISFGQWLRQARRRHDLTREALAELASCAVPTLAKIEGGVRRPSRELAVLLLGALDVPEAERDAILQLARQPLTTAEIGKPAADTAALPAPSLPSRQLPVATTPLVGRAAERAALRERLADVASRLVTLTGPGGIGKTRLAMQAAADAAASFADGAAWVSLAELGSAAQVASTIADAVGCTFVSEMPPDRLLTFLRERHMLLALDNFEHLLDAAPLLSAIMRSAPAVTLLVTSRERLRIHGEWVIQLDGLPFATTERGGNIERYDATQLFLLRARQVLAGFGITPNNRDAIVQICRMLEGMPLGIELAAAWARVLSCQQIAAELARGIDLLSRAERDAPTRHQSMRAVFDHSWRLLRQEEQRALAALAVFCGGCQRDAAQEVAGASLATLAALVDKSLVRVQHGAGAPRYDLHELVRQYAAERLIEDRPGEREVRARYLRHYAALLRRWLPDLFSAERARAFAALEPDMDNLRAAWEQAVAARDADAVGVMALGLQSIYEDCGWLRAGAALFGSAVEVLRAAGDAPSLPVQLRVRLGDLVGRHGFFLSRCGQFAAARTLLLEGLTLLREGEPSLELANTLMNLGFVDYQIGNYERAEAWLSESAALSAALSAPFFEVPSLALLGATLLARGCLDEAEQALARAVRGAHAVGAPRGLTIALSFAGALALEQGRVSEAHALLRESLAISGRNRDRWGVGVSFFFLGRLALTQGDVTEAHYLLREASECFDAIDERYSRGMTLANLGEILLLAGDVGSAWQALGDAFRIAAEVQSPPITLRTLVGAAALHMHAGQPARAYELLTVAVHHPCADVPTHRWAEQLRSQAGAELPVDDARAIEQHATSMMIETAGDWALRCSPT